MTDDNMMSMTDSMDYERIEKFLRDEMTAEEEKTLKQELSANEELRSKAVAMAYLAKAMDAVGQEHDELVKDALWASDKDQIEDMAGSKIAHKYYDYRLSDADMEMYYNGNVSKKDIEREENAKRELRRITIRRMYRRVLSAAAVTLIFVVGGYQYYSYRITTGLGDEYATTFAADQQTVCRGAETSQDKTMTTELSTLFANVKEGKDLKKTTRRLSFLWQVSTMEYFNAYIDYAPLIGWNLAIAHLKSNEKDEAMKVLAVLADGRYGDAMAKKAKELMEKLNPLLH